jgi:hypothetical protein
MAELPNSHHDRTILAMSRVIRRIALPAWALGSLLLAQALVQMGRSQSPARQGDGGPAIKANIDGPSKLAFDSKGDLFIYEAPDDLPPAIREVAAKTKTTTTLWLGCEVSWPPKQADCLGPVSAILAEGKDRLLVAEFTKSRLRTFDVRSKRFSRVAGDGTREFRGDGRPAAAAGLVEPKCVAMDQHRNIFVCDLNRVRRIDSQTGIISTVAGSGQAGFSGDHGPALEAQFSFLSSIAVDAFGDLFIADDSNRIRKVDARTGIIETIAGTGRSDRFGFEVAAGLALNADLFNPRDLTLDQDGNLLFLNDANRVCRINLRTSLISTIAGVGQLGFDGDGGPASRAHIDAWGMALGPNGNLFLADWEHNRIRQVDAVTGIITTFAGNGLPQRGPHPPIL